MRARQALFHNPTETLSARQSPRGCGLSRGLFFLALLGPHVGDSQASDSQFIVDKALCRVVRAASRADWQVERL